MRIATFTDQVRRQLGLVSADGQQITAFAADQIDASRGALALVELLATGAACPSPATPATSSPPVPRPASAWA